MVGTLTAIGLILGGVGAATQAKGQIDAGNAAKQAGVAQQAAYDANADVAESQATQLDFNANVADEQAADAVAQGAQEEDKFRATVRGTIGSQRAGFASQGVDVGSGSAVDVQSDAAYLGSLDEQTIRTNAARTAWGYQVQAQDYRQGAAIARQGAAADRIGGTYAAAAGAAGQTQANLGAASSILGAASSSSLLLARYGWNTNTTKVGP